MGIVYANGIIIIWLQVVQSIVIKLGGIVLIFLTFIVMYSCIGVHLMMQPFEAITPVNNT